uniref:Uncharacterized protein n=1 Tax=Fundulus heteroclitus TaxID=8078 RepID=A0A3Q2QKA5_FUNHE
GARRSRQEGQIDDQSECTNRIQGKDLKPDWVIFGEFELSTRAISEHQGLVRCCWVFLWEKAYQVRDTAIESSVMTKVKGFGNYNNRVMDVADYVTPTQGGSVFCIITKMITTENQVQGYCPEVIFSIMKVSGFPMFNYLTCCSFQDNIQILERIPSANPKKI